MRKRLLAGWVVLLVVFACVPAFGGGESEKGPQGPIVIEGHAAVAGGYRVSVSDYPDVESKGYVFQVGTNPMKEEALEALRAFEITGFDATNFVGPILDLDIYAYEKDKVIDGVVIRKPVEEVIGAGGPAEGTKILVEIVIPDEYRKTMAEKGMTINDLKLLLWDKKEGWISADLESGIYGLEPIGDWGFQFYVKTWPADDRPIAVGG